MGDTPANGDALPATIGPWTLVEALPSSSGTDVSLVRGRDGREAVLKRHRVEDEQQGLAEAALLGLAHPGIAACIDVGRLPDDGVLYTVTERVFGEPLGVGALRGCTPEQVTKVAARLLAALSAVHDLGLLHRDIKPDNVFLERSTGRPVLLDFGLAVACDQADEAPLGGTPRAMAPELFAGRPASVASDLWAVGLLLAEAVSERQLVGTGSAEDMLTERRTLKLPATSSETSQRFGALLARLLSPAPMSRPESALAALAVLSPPDLTELFAESLEASRSAAFARADPRRAGRLAALARGDLWAEVFGAPDDVAASVWAHGRLAECARGCRQPDADLARRLDAQNKHGEQVAALAEALARRRPLVVLGVDGPADEQQRDIASRLAALHGVRLVGVQAPSPEQQQAVLVRWLGAESVASARLGATPCASWIDLDLACAELVRSGAVTRDLVGTLVDETRLPATWPLAGGADAGSRLSPSQARLLDLLCLSPRALSHDELAQLLEFDVRAGVDELVDARLVRASRSGRVAVFAPSDARLVRARGGGAADGPTRARLAELLVGAGREAELPSEEAAVAVAAVLGSAEAGSEQDDEGLSRLALACAATLRRVGRLDLAEQLLVRAHGGAPDGSPVQAALDLERIDVALRAGAFDRAEALLDAGETARPGDSSLAMRRGRMLALRGRFVDALPLLSGEDPSLAHDDAMLALQTRAHVLQLLGRSDEGLGVLREALRRHGDRHDRRAMTMIERRGFLERDLGRHDDAIRAFERARAMAEELGHHALVWSPIYNIGMTIRDRGEKRRGLAMQEEAAAVCEATGNSAGLITVLNSLGAGWLTLGRVDHARRHLSRALQLCREVGNPGAEAMLQNNSGEALAAEGRHDEAEEAWAESLRLRTRLGDRQGQAAVHLTRGPRRLQRGAIGEAREDLQAATTCLEGLVSPRWQVRADLFRARLDLEAGKPDTAAAAVERAARLAAENSFDPEAVTARALLARCGADSLADLEAAPGDDGAWTAEAFAARAERHALDGRVAQAEADLERACAVLADTPDGPVELHCLSQRLTLDLAGLDTELRHAEPEVGRVGRLLSRVARDVDRARELAAIHGSPSRVQQIDRLAERFSAMDDNRDIAGLATLAERMRNLERLAEITKTLSEERDTQALFDLIIDSAIELTGAARGFIILFDGKAESFRAARNIDASTITDPQFQVSHSVARTVVREGVPLLTANAVDDPMLTSAASISELKLLSILCVPIAWRGRVQGAVYLDHPRVVGRFSESQQDTVLNLAEQAAIALANARLSEGLADSNRELKSQQAEIERLNEALQERLQKREAELRLTRESLDASRRALGLRYDYSNIITRSPAMHAVLDALDRVTETDFPVVIHGESGTGKELLAHAIHFNGPRKAHDYLSINCAAIPAGLIESELFGAVRGAFTGADRDRKGLFARADGGTLFLDEIGDMSLEVQARLLRVLQEKEFLPVGGTELVKVDVRVLCATHHDLDQRKDEGLFREDLFYRLAVGRLELPPLRERTDDIALLLQHFVERHGGSARTVDPEAMAVLEARPWPGNVRELENFAMNLVMFEKDGDHLGLELVRRLLGEGGSGAGEAAVRVGMPSSAPLKDRLQEFERQQVLAALEEAGGSKAAAARALGVPLRSLYKRLERLGL